MVSSRTILICFAVFCAAHASASSLRTAPAAPAKDIVQLAAATKDLSTLVTAVKAAGLVSTLEGKGPFTVFAPTNEAFAKLPKTALDYLLDPHNKADLAKVLTYHVVASAVKASDLKNGESIKTVEGTSVTASVSKSGVKINDSNVTTADVLASNGVVHIIDSVLLPKDLKLPTTSVVGLAAATKDFSTLVTAVKAAGLVDTLSAEGPFTVFAPTNEAFARVHPYALKKLLSNKSLLTKVLTYHVLPQRVYADEIECHSTQKTVEGAHLYFETYKGKVYINHYASVVQADIEGSNGNVHAINRVLFPLGMLESLMVDEPSSLLSSLEAVRTVATLTTFDGAKGTTQKWREVNDPVMGGQSTGTFTTSNGVGVFDGEVKIVPKLQAPGFCNMQVDGASFPDISEANALQLVVRSTLAYSGFKVAFGPAPRSSFFFSSYKADFAVKASEEWQTITVPFSAFSSKWSPYTGEPTTKCADDASVCPDADHLKQLTSMEITAEGASGKFHLEVKSITAIKQ